MEAKIQQKISELIDLIHAEANKALGDILQPGQVINVKEIRFQISDPNSSNFSQNKRKSVINKSPENLNSALKANFIACTNPILKNGQLICPKPRRTK